MLRGPVGLLPWTMARSGAIGGALPTRLRRPSAGNPRILAAVALAVGCGGSAADGRTSDADEASPSTEVTPLPVEPGLGGGFDGAVGQPTTGSNPSAPASETPGVALRCPAGGALAEDIEVDEQSELDALQGCVQLQSLWVWAALDLTPLRSLERVEGVLRIAPSGRALNDCTGLENLQSAGDLRASNVGNACLLALSSLSSLGGLTVTESDIEDDSALRNVSGLRSVAFRYNPRLRSLAALSTAAELDLLMLDDSPLLDDISAFSGVESVRRLVINQTGITNLDALAGLRGSVDIVSLSRNPELTNVSGLAGLRSVEAELGIQGDGLTDLSGLAGLERVNSFSLQYLPALQVLPVFSQLTSAVGILLRETTPLANGEGTRLSFPALRDLGSLYITNNPGLRAVEAPILQAAGSVWIEHNSSLSAVGFASLEQLSSALIIKNNPMLPAATLSPLAMVTAPFQQLAGMEDPVPPDECQITDCVAAATSCGPYTPAACDFF